MHLGPMPFAKESTQGLWFYKTPSLTLAIGPQGGRTMVLPTWKVNLNKIIPSGFARNQPLDSSGCLQNISGATEKISSFFNDAYTKVKD